MTLFPISRRPTIAQISLPVDTPAANDSGSLRPSGVGKELDTTVASVLGDVIAHACPTRVNAELSLDAPGRHVNANPIDLEFAISGLLVTYLRHMEDGDGGVLRVATEATLKAVRIVVVGDDVPPLTCLRAATQSGGSQGRRDATLVHCRRLIEALGGSFGLTAFSGRIGFEITLPIQPHSRTSRLRAIQFPTRTLFDTPLRHAS